ncbi:MULTISPECIES: L-threonylcarbamoyladenylate synthase [unclassified Flavobacterium]|uniref:L-threonylcarbamoyladenylate synthase n=1 Tax=unclassified Flavobacterium TaxID=196869 RepID=UPI001F1339EB|nr:MULTISPECIES: L-threonylcarbamoyladenylate synthase [unclassified Flavobacterium]UMY65651.1 threonylcarbamoyl-AMP synthase [Flavobacterium sp. HJ-32-4]
MAEISSQLEPAVAWLTRGDVVAIPTETVYGLAGNALDETAISRVFEVKKRPRQNPLIVHLAGVERLDEFVTHVPETARKLAAHFWPGPLTMVLPKSERISLSVTAGQDTVAVRVPDHPLTLALLQALPFPLVAPSANPYGYISPTSAQHVERQLGDKVPYILDGGSCKKGIESTIIGFKGETPVVYRAGSLPIAAIEAVVGRVEHPKAGQKAVVTAGMSTSHYAPRTPLYLTHGAATLRLSMPDGRYGLLAFRKQYDMSGWKEQIVLSPSGNLEEAAHRLYEALHTLDEAGLDAIIAEYVPNTGLGEALNDRLRRAALHVLE